MSEVRERNDATGRRHRPFTPEWALAFRDAIEADTEFRRVGAAWRWPIAFVLEAAPELGYPEPVAVELALEGGRCRAAELRTVNAVTAPFVFRAPYAVWERVMRGELEPVAAVTRGELRVTGSLMTLMLHARVATVLCGCARDATFVR